MLSTSFYKGFKAACFTAAAVASFQASADIVISGTRIVYQQSQKDVIVSLDNRGKKPLLVQSWLDDGRDDTNPQELKLPFIITPPVSRIDPQKVNPFGSHTWVVHCRKIANPYSGSMCSRFHRSQK